VSSGTNLVVWGNLGRDPELKNLPSGTAVCEGSVAINPYTGPNQPQKTIWFAFKIFGKRGERLLQHGPKKGQGIILTGEFDQEEWTDRQTGAPRSKLVIRADRWEFKDPPPPRDQQQPQGQQQARYGGQGGGYQGAYGGGAPQGPPQGPQGGYGQQPQYGAPQGPQQGYQSAPNQGPPPQYRQQQQPPQGFRGAPGPSVPEEDIPF
jgi:single-strand DNA-binding protein